MQRQSRRNGAGVNIKIGSTYGLRVGCSDAYFVKTRHPVHVHSHVNNVSLRLLNKKQNYAKLISLLVLSKVLRNLSVRA